MMEKTEGRKIASIEESLPIEVDGIKQKLIYKGIEVFDQPKSGTAFIIYNPKIKVSKREALVTDQTSALSLCHLFSHNFPELNQYKNRIIATKGDLRDFGYFTDNTIGLVSGKTKDSFAIQTQKVQKSFFQEIHCSIKQ